jgi:quercetin dioxygenase-like cupin family protein
MRSWSVAEMDVAAGQPEIISSSDDTRAIVINLPAGEQLTDHEVHERAWVILVDGEAEISTPDGGRAEGGAGLVVEFEPRERHEVLARTDARLLLLLTPWPGVDHPGALTLDEKAEVRQRAAERAGEARDGSARE